MRVTEVCSAPSPLPSPARGEGTLARRIVQGVDFFVGLGLIAARGLRQAEAAKILGATQPRVSDLLRGRIDLFSTDAIIDMLARFGVRVKIVLKPSRRGLKAA